MFAYHRTASTGIVLDWPTIQSFFTFTAGPQSCAWCEDNALDICTVADCSSTLTGSDGSIELVYASGTDSYTINFYDDVKLSLTSYYLRKKTRGDVSIT
mmetsp:Transcript_12386/g.19289  ORF Transcript_12386/g.19289 Transcript_12386/m.19289 type:complete len:99 (+) Transcript_12386:2102-2398(+)